MPCGTARCGSPCDLLPAPKWPTPSAFGDLWRAIRASHVVWDRAVRCSLLHGHGTFSTSKVGGGWRLAVGGWQLAVGGWRLAVGGPWGLSLTAVLCQNKIWFLKDRHGLGSLPESKLDLATDAPPPARVLQNADDAADPGPSDAGLRDNSETCHRPLLLWPQKHPVQVHGGLIIMSHPQSRHNVSHVGYTVAPPLRRRSPRSTGLGPCPCRGTLLGAGASPDQSPHPSVHGSACHKCPEPFQAAPPPPPPRVTFRLVVVSLRGPGRSPALPFACCVGSLRSVGRCSLCSRWCRFRVRGAQWLVCRGCARCGGMCRASAPPTVGCRCGTLTLTTQPKAAKRQNQKTKLFRNIAVGAFRCHRQGTPCDRSWGSPFKRHIKMGTTERRTPNGVSSFLPDPLPRCTPPKWCRAQKEAKERTKGKESLWLLEAPVRKMIRQMHTPARTSQ